MRERQLQILRYIFDCVDDKGYPPTVREICDAVGLASTSTVHGHLNRLEEGGYLFKDSTKPRALEITQKGLDKLGINTRGIPMLGTVTAGQPITAYEDIEGYFPKPPHLAESDEDLFMLKIRGDSMIEAGILNGDYVLVRQQQSAENGEIVIAMTDADEATCKRFFKEDGHIRLQPENHEMAPIILDNCTILGKVISLFREHTF
ncbi:transcriptional repressor LexA [Aerococcus sanguinicola]|uniref:LexA repressor n=1 Tax=Aerococcus sanguinicola TaxID=119206 RepID=A0A109RDQ3_9LACT|nr:MULTISPECIES: transcriptional repressor LexA [Aerococcus]AMB94824.1 LexA family transcriptional regulator [Aerococcus sanguinicola]MDK6233606.1 transcriptional repressor LexA [Aerococcus sp. UMB10185]MDK6804184.1 transcriptional repressor LexA [Aerococcus sp. UMB7834]MDK6855711.1 transcriptional repressor LexA [Aerococcus sp. UMB7533]MDK7049597.1 transcriptional repressor LexA [Aerococcus sanguinicola]